MHLNNSMKLFVTVSIIIFLLIGFILPSSVIAQPHTDDVDGIWTDTFDEQNSTRCLTNGTSRCVWEKGEIHLVRTSQGGRNYSFLDGGSFTNNQHKAYYYVTAFPLNRILGILFSPVVHTTKYEHLFDSDFQYPNIEKFGESTNRYAVTSSVGMKKNVVHHFRFKLDGTADSIGDLFIYWYGKAENARTIELYYWEYSSMPFLSTWKKINSTDKTGDRVLFYNLSQSLLKNAINTDNYIDICVVAYGSTTPCTLFTDYVKLQSRQQEGFKIGYGIVQTNLPISLSGLSYWDLLTWDDYESGSAAVKYQILYNNAGSYIPVENSVLNGNEQGFSTPPVSLIPLGNLYNDIKIQANLSTNNPAVTPKIFSWTVTWQTGNKWQDHFNSDYRIDVKDMVNVNNGAVNISMVSGDWPMFGQNPSNTRSSSGSAALTRDLYWWSNYHELRNQTPHNLVIDGESLYVSAINGNSNIGSVYRYSTIVVPANKTGKLYTDIYPGSSKLKEFSNLTSQGKTIVGSPAVSGKYLVVATGDLNSQNYVYAYKKDAPSNGPLWTFDYSTYNPNEPKICYWGSPTIAQGLVYLTTWGGDSSIPGYHINNMILALDLTTGQKKWNFTFPQPSKPLRTSTWSFSTPAYSNGKVVVGCMNGLSDSLFALDANNGSLLWNTTVGAIGKAAPVVYNDTVYIVSESVTRDGAFKKTMLNAVNLDDGGIRWQASLGRTLFALSLDLTYCLAQTTPAIANGTLYVTSPDGYVTAFDLSKNNTELWTQKIYTKSATNPILTSSPAYADGILYVGTPDGAFHALNTASNGTNLWDRQTFPPEQKIAVVTDPIVSNGIVFFGDENGRLYVCGKFVEPNKQVNGSIISVPIQLPQGFWWKKFYASMQTNASASVNKITFSLLDADQHFIKTLTNRSDLSSPNETLGRTLRLRADFWAKNSSTNPTLFLWNVSFFSDQLSPVIDLSTLTPNPKGWLNVVIPQFTVNVKDNGTGLLISSAQYRLEYVSQNITYRITEKAACTGLNGTTAVQQMTVNLTKLDFYNNITALHSLQLNITDLAGNLASVIIPFKQDTQKPGSFIKTQTMKKQYNATTPFIWINATAYDNGTGASGIRQVDLYYRYSTTGNFSGDWILFANSTRKSPSWEFFFTTPAQQGGYFELSTIATDNASNVEDFPVTGDVSFVYDWTIPDLPDLSGDTLWFKERPQLSAIFTDDFQLYAIQYRPNFDTVWTTVASNINQSSYHANWPLKQEYWDQMNDGEVYYLNFRINDTVGNTRLVTENSQALIIRKDVNKPVVTIEVPNAQNEWITSGNFTVSAFANDHNGSGISEVALYYRYSKDNHNWTEWIHYDGNLTAAPFEWKFNAPNGDGYYKFQITAVDYAGNEATSEVFSSGVARLPTNMILIMYALVAVLLLIGALLYVKWRKRK